MQKSFIFLAGIFASLPSIVHSAGNTDPLHVISFETRDDGYHAVYLDGPILNEGCTLNDRAIIVESSSKLGSKTLVSTVLSSAVAKNRVVLRVSGCVAISLSQTSTTAPLVTKVQAQY
ncbi:hypothetical protein [Permianibacter aggregans]|uniref:Uncharacterized protein n=1 Tax=Permianibacter aggregans TaxID=1510150 RepID=A0A4R6UVG6_9GAMM|nr:hypothetical protein [Permianibacter aggregans]QGX41531.1 hypothetical protein E2H98_18400 [Permianibacter aggregans]TDQ51330.1 hypothetical protein EV696_101304 [Permianibacter aggregans]